MGNDGISIFQKIRDYVEHIGMMDHAKVAHSLDFDVAVVP
jgi:hypothetical protein